MLQNKLPTVLSITCLFLLIGLYFLSVPLLKGEASPDVSIGSDESEKITEMFRKGLRINSQNNPDLPDADAYGAALTQIALERFVECPNAASKMRSTFVAHIENSSAMARYAQWNIFLEYLERSLTHCTDTESMRRVWMVRSHVTEEQGKILLEITRQAEEMLDAFIVNLKKKSSSSEKTVPMFSIFEASNELQNLLDFLLNEHDSDTNVSSDVNTTVDRIRTKATGIADAMNKGIETKVSGLERKIEAEKQKDISPNGADAFVPEKDSEELWKTGSYQKLLDEILQLNTSLENDVFAYWEGLRNEDAPTTSNGIRQRLASSFENARRLQSIRYNLWATRRLSSNATFDTLSLIDTGLLMSSVGALYSIKESELMQNDVPIQRAGHVRKLLLGNKAGLNAF